MERLHVTVTFKVRCVLENRVISELEFKNLTIINTTVDRIVNSAADRMAQSLHEKSD